ncbi:universal stress protein [Rhizohabitans arisaemae]|uniref:universal stress protein n=1 Tax=Rhizohabitans arisaemae TaxID=2720610 RepID=UPI0024B121F9|nr:universal stress protein [Rhizohabitans arisaemae]
MSKPVIVGADGSEAATAAIEWAADDAARAGLPLRIVTAVYRSPHDAPKFPGPRWADKVTRTADEVLADAETTAKTRQPGIEVTRSLVEGGAADVLRDQAEEAAELVVGSRGLGGFAGAVLGSVSLHVVGHVPAPVVVVRETPEHVYGEIVVGVDDSDACEPALAYAFEQARLRGAGLRAIHAWHLPVQVFAPGMAPQVPYDYDMEDLRIAEHNIATAKLALWEVKYPEVTVTVQAPCAHPVEALTEASGTADLLVVGSHGRGGFASAILGSVSRGVLHHARSAVAIVRA